MNWGQRKQPHSPHTPHTSNGCIIARQTIVTPWINYSRPAHMQTNMTTMGTGLKWCGLRPKQTMGWLRLVGSLKLQVSFAKEPFKRDHILQKGPMILRSLLIVATPYHTWSHIPQTHTRTCTRTQHAHARTCTRTWTRARTHSHLHYNSTLACSPPPSTHARIHVHIHARTHARTRARTRTYMHANAHISTVLTEVGASDVEKTVRMCV